MQFMTLKKGQLQDYIKEKKEKTDLWVFHHIPKTAGSSLVAELLANATPYHNIVPDYLDVKTPHSVKIKNAVNLFLKKQKTIHFNSVSGHLFPTHLQQIKEKNSQSKIFTYLRHPVKRIISEYYYSCSPIHPLHQSFREKYPLFNDYINDPIEANKQAFYMFQDRNINAKDALKLMQEQYDFIGLQELYTDSFSILSNIIWDGSIPKARKRVTTSSKKKPLTENMINKIISNNALDMKLYTAVTEVYKEIATDLIQLKLDKNSTV